MVQQRANIKSAGSRTSDSAGQVVLSKKAAFLIGFGLLLFIVWIFILGVLAGRGLIFENERIKMLEQRLAKMRIGKPPQVTVEDEAAESQENLTFYKSLKQGRGEEKIEFAPLKKPAKKTEAPRAKSVDAQAPKQASKQQPLSETEDKPKSPDGLYTVQVAAMETSSQAEKLVKSLKAKGFPSYHYAVQVASGRLFRIRVGPYRSKTQAESAKTALTKTGFKGIFIIKVSD